MPIDELTAAVDPRGATRAMAYAMHGLEQRFEVVAANLANSETSGHKRLVARAELFSQELDRANAAEASTPSTVVRDFTQGDLVETGNPGDLALEGPGFFAVEQNGQLYYTRALRVHADTDGTLLDEHGARVLGEGGPVRLSAPLARLQVENDGTVKGENADVGRLRIVNFVEPQKLSDDVGGYWRADDRLEVTGAQTTQVRQRTRENSNVVALDELVQLITIQRQYEATQRAMSVESELRRRLNEGLR
jgi:flagellar basal body rod protein FlgG